MIKIKMDNIITLKDDWNNPIPRIKEREGLALLTKEISEGIVKYEGTTSENIKKLEEELIKSRDSYSTDNLRDYLDSLMDYCFGNISRTDNYNEQMLNYRRLGFVISELDKLPPEEDILITAIKSARELGLI